VAAAPLGRAPRLASHACRGKIIRTLRIREARWREPRYYDACRLRAASKAGASQSAAQSVSIENRNRAVPGGGALPTNIKVRKVSSQAWAERGCGARGVVRLAQCSARFGVCRCTWPGMALDSCMSQTSEAAASGTILLKLRRTAAGSYSVQLPRARSRSLPADGATTLIPGERVERAGTATTWARWPGGARRCFTGVGFPLLRRAVGNSRQVLPVCADNTSAVVHRKRAH
jgi:hypothetical protein